MYVVIGANGYIGSYMIKNILQYTSDSILAIGRQVEEKKIEYARVFGMQCDITDDRDIAKLSQKVALMENVKIIYLAAYHHPDDVKKNPKVAWNVNVTSLSKVLNSLDNVKCLYYVSTEMVYGEGNKERLFSEKDELKPVNLYGVQKKVAEAIVLGYGYNVVRFPFVIGPSLLPGKKHFYDIIVDTVRSGNVIEMFEDAYKSALDFDTATKLVIELTKMDTEVVPKILNVAGDSILSKYDIGVEIAKANGLDEQLIKSIRLSQDNKIFNEKRASCTLLDNTLLKKTLQLDTIKMKF